MSDNALAMLFAMWCPMALRLDARAAKAGTDEACARAGCARVHPARDRVSLPSSLSEACAFGAGEAEREGEDAAGAIAADAPAFIMALCKCCAMLCDACDAKLCYANDAMLC
eukprot:1122453-Rhodomonas_salina.2